MLQRTLYPSLLLALNSLSGRRGRTMLMVAAVGMAASLIVAVSCGFASLQSGMERQLARSLGAADARIIHLFNGVFEEDLLDEVRSWPGVVDAAGRFQATLTLIHADQRKDRKTGRLVRGTPRAVGIDPQIEQRIAPVQMIDGRHIDAPDEISLDPIASELLRAGVGDVLHVQRFGEPIALRVVGIFERQTIGALQRPQIRIDRGTLAEAVKRPGMLSSIAITLAPGTDAHAFCAAHADALPDALSLEPATMVRTGFDRRVMVGQIGLTIAAVLSFMAASFIIVTGLTTAVTERQRELAILRCVGGLRSQLFTSQLWVGAIIGLLGAAIGAPLGIALAGLLIWWFADVITTGLNVSGLGLVLGTVGSFAAGIIGAIYPAWMAASTSPLRALAATARAGRVRGIVICAMLGLACLAAQLVAAGIDDAEDRFWAWVTFGLPILHVGYFLLAVPITLLAATLLGPTLAALLRIPRPMLARSVWSQPMRFGLTAGAMMVGMGILTATWSEARALHADWLGRIRLSDGFVFRTTGISADEQAAIAQQPFVKEVCPIGYMPVRVLDRHVFGIEGLAPESVICVGFDPEIFFRVNKIDWVEGDPPAAIESLKRGDGVIIAREFKMVRGMGVGDRIRLGAGRVDREFEIVGIVEAPGLELAIQFWGIRDQYMDAAVRCVFMDWDVVGNVFNNRDAYMMQINLTEPLDDAQVRDRLREIAPGVG